MTSREHTQDADSLDQLIRWQARGWDVQITCASDGWYCAISTPGWFARDGDHLAYPHTGDSLRYVTAAHPTPQAAVRAALEVLRP